MRITTIHIICTQDVPAPRLERLFKRGDKSKLRADQVVRIEAILSLGVDFKMVPGLT